MTSGLASLLDRPVAGTGQPACRQETFYLRGGTSMDTKKKGPSKNGRIRDLPKSKQKLPEDQKKAVKGGGTLGGTGGKSTGVGWSFG
jgi:hypothetical protein